MLVIVLQRQLPNSPFSYKIKEMDEIPFHQKPWFRSASLAIILLGIYVYNLIWQGGVWENILGIAFDLIVFVLLFQVCVFFYAQFILPMRTLEDRRKIVSRLWLHAGQAHGPAIFVKNGRKVERAGESEKRGPGILWLDTASAVVTRTSTAFKQVLGPGVHFIDANEKIASIISLHTQTHSIGLNKDDVPFESLIDNPTGEERRRYEETQARRMAVSAMTRDGIEVIPNISLAFKIDARPAGPGEKGSHFGFDKDAVEKAARGEGINPNSTSEEQRRVAWNQLPAMIAADLWREYLSKFTLSELFDPGLPSLPNIPQPEAPPAIMEMPKTPLLVKRSLSASILKNINNTFERKLDQLIPKEEPPIEEEISAGKPLGPKKVGESRSQTALQIINQMMKARMSQAVVAKLDECGRLMEGYEISDEYKKLKERGIAVLSVGVSSLHFNPAIEAQLLERWNTNWLSNAKADRNRVERLQLAYNEKGKQQALLDHALTLTQTITKENPTSVPIAVKALLERTQSEIKLNDRLLSHMSNELESLDNLIRWVESKDL